MKKALVGFVLSTFVVGMFAFAVEAQRRGRRPPRRQPAAPAEAPRSAAIAPSLGDLHWGMSKEEVLTYFQNQAREKYRPLIAKARDGVAEDRLRQQLGTELRRIRESFVNFNGQHTGWDISFLQDEFTHNNSESMLQVNTETSQNFYFFINDHLWKWYSAFNADVFAGQNFDQFAQGVQTRFGAAVERNAELVAGRGRRHWLEWQDDSTRLRAIDQTQFYGFYCLVFESKETLGQLATLRRNVSKRGNGVNSLVEQVTSDDGARDSNPNQDIVDRLTGKIRNEPQAAQPQTPAKNNARPGAPAPQPSRSPTQSADEDPLSGAL